jgi:molybdate transport system substrate-binding protein
MTRLCGKLAVAACLATLLVVGCSPARNDRSMPIRVAAAADLTDAFTEVGRAFTQETGREVTFSYAATGLLTQQLREGAPFDLFAAANVSFVDDVIAAGVCDGTTKAPHARGRIVVWSHRNGIAPVADFSELADTRITRIAIANPEHAPYGMAAKQALEHAGIWGAVQSRIVYGENVRQTFQFAETRNVDAAIVALSLVVNDSINPWTLVPDSLHRPIDQALVVCDGGANKAGGLAFAKFVSSPAGRAIMRRHGFLLPGETPDAP